MIKARYHAGLLCVQVERPGLEGEVMRKIRGRPYKKWNCIIAPWTNFNCAKLMNEAGKYGWSGENDPNHALIEEMGWPVIIKEPSLFPDIKVMPNILLMQGLSERRLQEVEAQHLKRKLWKHQRCAFKALHRLTGAILDMGMGTGKTMTTIALICGEKHDFGMIVCPKAVIDVWPLEFSKNCSTDFRIYTGTGKKTQSISQYVHKMEKEIHNAKILGQPFVFVCNYEAMWQGALKEFIENNKFDYIVFDEVHRLKAPSGTASKFAAKLRKSAMRIFGCSGTILPHSPMDAFGTFRAIDPSVFGEHFIPFRTTFAEMGGFEGKQIVKYKNEQLMHKLISSISYRITTEDAVELPEAIHVQRKCKLSKETRKIYKDMSDEMFAEFEGNELTAANALVKVLRLMQITSGVIKNSEGDAVRVGTEKADLFADTLEDIDKSEPIVVFCRFTADIQAVTEAAIKSGRTVSELSGKKNELKAWQSGETDLLVVQIKAGKEGVDFTRASICFYYSMTHSLGEYEQSLRRNHRPGQTRSVRYIHLVAEDTVDEDIYKGLEKKKNVVLSVLEGIIRQGYETRGRQNEAMVNDAMRMAMRIAGV